MTLGSQRNLSRRGRGESGTCHLTSSLIHLPYPVKISRLPAGPRIAIVIAFSHSIWNMKYTNLRLSSFFTDFTTSLHNHISINLFIFFLARNGANGGKYKRGAYLKSISKHNISYFSIRIQLSWSEVAKDGLLVEPIEEGLDALSGDGMVSDCCCGISPRIWIHRWRKSWTILHRLQWTKGGGELWPGRL